MLKLEEISIQKSCNSPYFVGSPTLPKLNILSPSKVSAFNPALNVKRSLNDIELSHHNHFSLPTETSPGINSQVTKILEKRNNILSEKKSRKEGKLCITGNNKNKNNSKI